MKRIIAMIKPNMLDDVVFALHSLDDFPGAAISEVRAIGRGRHAPDAEDRSGKRVGFPVFVRLEIVCRADQAETIVDTIATRAHTGLPDDGSIVICPVDDAVRIRTGERGHAAL